MNPGTASAQAPSTETPPAATGEGSTSELTIGDLARRTGIAPATLRMWESRHGLPRPRRLDSGHRRYVESDVAFVREVLRRCESGMRLETAIAGAALGRDPGLEAPGLPSIYAAMRTMHPSLQPQRLKKSTLLAISWAIEDECCVRAQKPVIFGAFQQESYYRKAEERWSELARIARSTMVFASFSQDPPKVERTTMVHLLDDVPMRREWAVVCDADDYPAMLTAWELPGQSTVPDRQRLFEAIWTVDPTAVRDASRACAQAAQQLGHPEGARLLYDLADTPPPPSRETQQAASLLNRVVAYVDRTP